MQTLTQTAQKVMESKTTIRFQDCDPFGHLNNSKYLDYMLNAREDHLKDQGIDLHELGKTQGISWVVGGHEILYKNAAKFNESVIIESRLTDFSNKWTKAEMIMYNHDKTEVKAILWTTFVHISLRDQKAIPHNSDLISLMERMIDPVNQKTIQERMISKIM